MEYLKLRRQELLKNQAHNQFFVPHNVLDEEKFLNMKLSSQMLYIHLCKLKNRLQKENFYRHIKTLARETGMNVKTVIKAKQELIKAQYIGVDRDYYTSSGNRSADVFYLNGYCSSGTQQPKKGHVVNNPKKCI